eukprot:9061187-Alexandrium_andersonii.AAC.1
MQEDGAQGNVLLQQAVVPDKEDALLLLEGAGVEERRIPKDVTGNRAGARAWSTCRTCRTLAFGIAP